MGFAPGHLAEHPLPGGIVGALGLGGYQLLGEVAGVGAGRLGSQAFLLAAPEPDPALPDAGTQLALHTTRLRDEAEAGAYVALASQLGLLRLSGYRIALERCGLRSKLSLVDPATGAVAATLADRSPNRRFGGGGGVQRLLAGVSALPAAGPPRSLGPAPPELLHQTLLALALGDDSLGGAEAAELADRALALARERGDLDPSALLAAARAQS